MLRAHIEEMKSRLTIGVDLMGYTPGLHRLRVVHHRSLKALRLHLREQVR